MRESRGVAWWVSDHCRHGVIEVVFCEVDFVIIVFTVSSRLLTTRLTL